MTSSHPNVKLFITHGGLLSLIETLNHGVPVLVIPIMGDQKYNAQQIVSREYGLELDITEVTEEALGEKIKDLLTNAKYNNSIKKGSQLFHDRLLDPLDTALFWIEYVISRRGAPHLKVMGVEMPWYQYFLLDVISVLFVAGFLTLYVFYNVVRMVGRVL